MSNRNNDIVVIVIFLVYIFSVGILSIKNNIKLFKETKESVQEQYAYSNANNLERMNLIKNSFENTFSNNLIGKYDYIDIYGLFQRILQKNVVEDVEDGKRVIRLKNGNLAFIYPEIYTDEFSEKIIAVSNYSKERGIYMLYTDAPWRIENKDDLPFYLKDNVNKTDQKFIKKLKENDVNVLELKKKLDGNKNEWFFHTDHHWNIDTAFNAYKLIMKSIEKNTNIEIEDKYLSDYTIKVYDDVFLGTYGKRVGKYYGGVDDFSYITPNFETELDVINNRDWNNEVSHLKGNFEKVFMYPEYIDNTKLERKMSTYYTYTEGIKAEVKIKNLKANNNKKVLILTDSFGEPVFPFVSLNFQETRVIDVRRYRAIRLYTYIEKYDPDVILFIHTPTSLYDKSCYNFQLK